MSFEQCLFWVFVLWCVETHATGSGDGVDEVFDVVWVLGVEVGLFATDGAVAVVVASDVAGKLDSFLDQLAHGSFVFGADQGVDEGLGDEVASAIVGSVVADQSILDEQSLNGFTPFAERLGGTQLLDFFL